MNEKRCIAKFIPQAWINDYAVEVDDGHCEFDITDQINAMPREEALNIEDDSHDADNLWYDNPASGTNPHSGPFYIECEEAIHEYLGEE